MEEQVLLRTPIQKGHMHFYNEISGFPGLHEGPSLQDRDL
jgi:hypothetical protein